MLEDQFGHSVYERMDAPASPEQKAVLSKLSPRHRRPSGKFFCCMRSTFRLR